MSCAVKPATWLKDAFRFPNGRPTAMTIQCPAHPWAYNTNWGESGTITSPNSGCVVFPRSTELSSPERGLTRRAALISSRLCKAANKRCSNRIATATIIAKPSLTIITARTWHRASTKVEWSGRFGRVPGFPQTARKMFAMRRRCRRRRCQRSRAFQRSTSARSRGWLSPFTGKSYCETSPSGLPVNSGGVPTLCGTDMTRFMSDIVGSSLPDARDNTTWPRFDSVNNTATRAVVSLLDDGDTVTCEPEWVRADGTRAATGGHGWPQASCPR